MKNHPWPRYKSGIMRNKKKRRFFFTTIFGVKEPRHSETILAKKRYTSIVAGVNEDTPIGSSF